MAAFSKLSKQLTPKSSAIIALAAVLSWTALRYKNRKEKRFICSNIMN